MPKQRITKEMVVEAAFEIAREQGMEQVVVKSIAAASTAPYSQFTVTVKIWMD